MNPNLRTIEIPFPNFPYQDSVKVVLSLVEVSLITSALLNQQDSLCGKSQQQELVTDYRRWGRERNPNVTPKF